MELVKTLPSGQDPELFVLHPSGNPLYIANEDDNLVTVVDIEQGKVLAEIPVGVEPEGMGISPDGKLLVTTSETTNMAHFIDTATHTTIDNVLVDSRPRVAEFTADGSQVWVSAEIGGTVTVIETGTRKVVAKIGFKIPGVQPDAIQPVGVRISPRRQARLRRARSRQSCRRDRRHDLQGREISAGRPARLAARLHARREAPVHHQRRLQRRVGDRRGEIAGRALHQGRTLSLGRRGGGVLIAWRHDASRTIIGLLAAGIIALGAPPARSAADADNPDWPCVQRKVATLTSAQMWDGADRRRSHAVARRR